MIEILLTSHLVYQNYWSIPQNGKCEHESTVKGGRVEWVEGANLPTYKCCVGQKDLSFIGEDVELDHVAFLGPVDNFRVWNTKDNKTRLSS